MNVGNQPFKARLFHALLEHVRPKVEFVIAQGGEVQPQRVPHFDHLAPAKQAGGHRGRDGIARKHKQSVGIFCLDFGAQRLDARKAALAAVVHGVVFVDVVEMQKGDVDGGCAVGLTGSGQNGPRPQQRSGESR